MFMKKFFELVNINAKACYTFHHVNRSLGVSIDAISYLFSAICLGVVLLLQTQSAWIGLTILTVLKFAGAVQWLIR